jgi:hypothetical protein
MRPDHRIGDWQSTESVSDAAGVMGEVIRCHGADNIANCSTCYQPWCAGE